MSDGLTALQVAKAADALRVALAMSPEVFPFGQVLSMLGDELAEWRARGLSDASFAATVHRATGVALPDETLARA